MDDKIIRLLLIMILTMYKACAHYFKYGCFFYLQPYFQRISKYFMKISCYFNRLTMILIPIDY